MKKLHKYILSNLTRSQRLELLKWYKLQVHSHDCNLNKVTLDTSSPGKEIHVYCSCGHFLDLTEYN